MHLLRVVPLVVLALAVLPACGDDDEGTLQATAAPSPILGTALTGGSWIIAEGDITLCLGVDLPGGGNIVIGDQESDADEACDEPAGGVLSDEEIASLGEVTSTGEAPDLPEGFEALSQYVEFSESLDQGGIVSVPLRRAVADGEEAAFYSYASGEWFRLADAGLREGGKLAQARFEALPDNVIVLLEP